MAYSLNCLANSKKSSSGYLNDPRFKKSKYELTLMTHFCQIVSCGPNWKLSLTKNGSRTGLWETRTALCLHNQKQIFYAFAQLGVKLSTVLKSLFKLFSPTSHVRYLKFKINLVRSSKLILLLLLLYF
jgi:hypothetical protein